MIVTVDIGNSRIKMASWQADVIVGRGVTDYDNAHYSSAFDRLFLDVPRPSEIYALCVATEEVAQALDDWVTARWQMDVDYLKTTKKYKNIVNAYEDPAQHGVDRWAGLVAANQSFSNTAVCVISAGTATTFDFVDKNGQHLGGYILPSFYTMHKALQADTANVASTSSMRLQQNLPVNTSDAVNQGLHKFMQAGIRELCRLAEDSMGEPVRIVVTGGFAKNILDYPAMPAMHYRPDLVMQGLYDMMQQQNKKGSMDK
ncbi:MAG: type III pantothenate kinase [Gammaproteobacteria bacterium]|nr:type III pantothenate kinase [Gammaproteobacteria bacterium]